MRTSWQVLLPECSSEAEAQKDLLHKAFEAPGVQNKLAPLGKTEKEKMLNSKNGL